ncbi:MAG TPA: hypothetical protein VGO22_08480 [Pseudorhizobium sp.]|nr:hypothetical protein [Pseudorhizobium sp.]
MWHDNEEPAETYGYRVDVTEADDGEKTERVLKAMKEAKSVAQEIQMTFGVDRFRFVPLGSKVWND